MTQKTGLIDESVVSAAGGPCAPERTRGRRIFAVLAVLVPVLISFALRCHALTAPISDRWSYRQTQTAITVWCFVTEGVDPWHYQTPVLGSPWQVPFEFPLAQLTAAMLVKVGVANIDLACRLTNLLYFTASVPFLFLLARRFFRSRIATVCVTAAYMCDPYAIFWSQSAMIDYCSVFFALGYLYFFARYLGGPGRWLALAMTVLFGFAGALAKITTLATVAVPLAWLAVAKLREQARAGGSVLAAPVIRTVLACAVCALVPLAVGQAWVVHTDHIKAASPATVGLTSAGLRQWNFGTLAQRTRPADWGRIVERIDFPFLLAVGLAWAGARLRRPGRGFVWAMALSAALTVVLFFNLYQMHDYYLMALTPAIAVAAGLGLFAICFRIVRRPAVQWGLLGVLLLVMAGKGYSEFVKDAKYVKYERPFDPVALGNYLQTITAPDERIVVEGAAYTSEVLYYARRKGLMWNPLQVKDWPEAEKNAVADMFRRDNYTAVLAPHHEPETLRYWKRHQFLGVVEGFQIYKVSDAE